MSKDLIDRGEAIAIIENKQKELCPLGRFRRNVLYGTDRDRFDAWQEIADEIDGLPTVQPEVRRGKWVKGKDLKIERKIPPIPDCFYCSACGEEAFWDTDYGQQKFDYCHSCGADMREVDNE